MGYSVNPQLVERRRHLLQNLERNKQCAWILAKDPVATKQQAYDIREALYIASLYPARYPKLAAAHKRFAIHIVEPGRIEARVKTGRTEGSTQEVSIQGLEPQGRPSALVGMSNAESIIDSWKQHLPSSDPLHFTSTLLNDEEMMLLHKWTKGWKPKLMLLVDQENQTLTVSHLDPSIKEFAWQPAKKVEKVEENFDL